MLEDKNPVDWVQKRLCCGPEFIALALMERVKSDVEKANFRRANGCGFKVAGDSGRFFVECEIPDDPSGTDRSAVCFTQEQEQLTVTNGGPTRIVTWK